MDENKASRVAPGASRVTASRVSTSVEHRSMLSLERQSVIDEGRSASRVSRVPRTPEEAATVVAERARVRGPASQLLDEMPPFLARGMVYLIVAFLFVMALWACVFKVDVVTEADGKLRPRDAVIEIQATQSGQVVELKAKPGQFVTTDTPLFVVLAMPFQASVDKLKQEIVQLETQTKVQQHGVALLSESLEKEREPSDPAWKDCPLPELVSIIEDLKVQKKKLEEAMINDADIHGQTGPAGVTRESDELRLRLEQKRDDLAKAKASLQALEAELTTATGNEKVAADLLSTHEGLYAKGIVSKVEYLGQKQTLAGARATLANAQAAVFKSRKDITQLDTDLKLLTDQTSRTLMEARRSFDRARATAENKLAQWKAELEERERKLKTNQRDLEMAERELKRTVVLSPRTGTIDEVKINHVGSTVSSGQTVITLVPPVPDQSALEAEVTLKNKDVGAVKEGQEAQIKVDAYSFNEWGSLHGKVRLISADATEKGEDYKAHIAIEPDTKEKPNRLESPDPDHKAALRPGMSVKVEIKKEAKRVIDFLLKPFQGLRRAHAAVNG